MIIETTLANVFQVIHTVKFLGGNCVFRGVDSWKGPLRKFAKCSNWQLRECDGHRPWSHKSEVRFLGPVQGRHHQEQTGKRGHSFKRASKGCFLLFLESDTMSLVLMFFSVLPNSGLASGPICLWVIKTQKHILDEVIYNF